MITLAAGTLALVAAYVVYGRFLERIAGVDPARATPAYTKADGVDYVALPTWRVFLVQLLNIAGLGPVFGAVMGALYGPVCVLWIVLGGIFVGAVHDFVAAQVSLRMDGASLTEIVAAELGPMVKGIMLVVTVALLVAVGVVFVAGPAKLLTALAVETGAFGTPDGDAVGRAITAATDGGKPAAADPGRTFSQAAPQVPAPSAPPVTAATRQRLYLGFCVLVFLYYCVATIFPIDVIIGRIYPFFGLALLVMVAGVAGLLLFSGVPVPELTLANLHPKGLALFPFMMITIACGAVSGFHATQSPIMARSITTERHARPVFMGAMLVESFIALVWAAAGYTFFGGTAGLASSLSAGGPGGVVLEVCRRLGGAGTLLALLGVIVLPITSGDTAYRGARLILADVLRLDQRPLGRRLALALPLFATGGAITAAVDIQAVWTWFAWLNQVLSIFTLYACATWLARRGATPLPCALPAAFMAFVCAAYLLGSPEAAALPAPRGSWIAGAVALATLGHFFARRPRPAPAR